MVAKLLHHTFHRLSRLLTTFLAQMSHVSDPVENPEALSSKTAGWRMSRSAANTDSTLPQIAPESTVANHIITWSLLYSPIEVKHDDGRSNKTFVSGQQWQGQRLDKSAVKYSTGSLLHL